MSHLIMLEQMISDDFKEQFLFFEELTPEAQLEFLLENKLEIEDIDPAKPIAKLIRMTD